MTIYIQPYVRFLCHLHHRPFLSLANFSNPYEGFHQAIAHRIITGGMYFPIETGVVELLPQNMNPFAHNLVAGGVTGSIIALITNPLSLIKYQSWGTHHKGRLKSTVLHLWSSGGFAPFTRGITVTLVRDIIWGSTFSSLRHAIPPLTGCGDEHTPGVASFLVNVFAGGVATFISSPINFVRNMQYGHSPSKPHPSAIKVLSIAWRESKTAESPVYHFVVKRLTVGWGTLRVALGIAFSSQVYDYLISQF